jgi:hypothetical protein
MAFEQLGLFEEPILYEIVKYFIEQNSIFSNGYRYYSSEHHKCDLLSREFDLTEIDFNKIKDKLKSLIFFKIKNDLSANLIDYLSINKENILTYDNLFSYIDEDYRYVIEYDSFIYYITEDELIYRCKDYNTGDIAEAFDVIEDKVVRFKVKRVVLERVE